LTAYILIIEYEANFANNVPEVKKCIEFIPAFWTAGK